MRRELVIQSGHSVHGHPLAIAEVRRILLVHAAEICPAGDLCMAEPSGAGSARPAR